MIGNPFGVNAAITYIHDFPRFVRRMKKLNPRTLTARIDNWNDAPKIEALRGELPNTTIIGRYVIEKTDGEFHTQPKAEKDAGKEWVASPMNCLNSWGRLGKQGGMLYLANEPGTAHDPNSTDDQMNLDRLVRWTVEALTMATFSETSLAVLGLGTGQPVLVNGEWDSVFDPILQMPPGTWQRHAINLHEYLPRPGRVLRFAGLFARAKTLHAPKQRIVLTEAGWDRDQNAREDSKLRGYKSRDISGGDFARQTIYVVENDYRPYIDDGSLMGVDGFCYGNSGGWEDMNFEDDDGFWEVIDGWTYYPSNSTPIAVQPVTPVSEEPTSSVQPNTTSEPPKEEKSAADEKPAIDLHDNKVAAILRSLADSLEAVIVDIRALADEFEAHVGAEAVG